MNAGVLTRLLVLVMFAAAPGLVAQPYDLTRLCGGPILTVEQFRAVGGAESEGTNINGPTLIRVPEWVAAEKRADPSARYYLYFAHHKGDYIRLAWASELCGPWRLSRTGHGVPVGGRGVLDLGADDRIALENDLAILDHVASPEVVVDDVNRRFVLYFHAPALHRGIPIGQKTFVATSSDGLDFNGAIEPVTLGSSYFRIFRHRDQLYAVANNSALYRAPDAARPWVAPPGFDVAQELWSRRCDPLIGVEISPVGTPMLPRHSWVRPQGDGLEVFFTRVGDVPERIMVAHIQASSADYAGWRSELPAQELMWAQPGWEGGDLTPAPSAFDWAPVRVNQLRDPFLFDEEGKLYLLYTGAGEQAIGLARLAPRGNP